MCKGSDRVGCNSSWQTSKDLRHRIPESRTVSQLKVPEGPQKATVVAEFLEGGRGVAQSQRRCFAGRALSERDRHGATGLWYLGGMTHVTVGPGALSSRCSFSLVAAWQGFRDLVKGFGFEGGLMASAPRNACRSMSTCFVGFLSFALRCSHRNMLPLRR